MKAFTTRPASPSSPRSPASSPLGAIPARSRVGHFTTTGEQQKRQADPNAIQKHIVYEMYERDRDYPVKREMPSMTGATKDTATGTLSDRFLSGFPNSGSAHLVSYSKLPGQSMKRPLGRLSVGEQNPVGPRTGFPSHGATASSHLSKIYHDRASPTISRAPASVARTSNNKTESGEPASMELASMREKNNKNEPLRNLFSVDIQADLLLASIGSQESVRFKTAETANRPKQTYLPWVADAEPNEAAGKEGDLVSAYGSDSVESLLSGSVESVLSFHTGREELSKATSFASARSEAEAAHSEADAIQARKEGAECERRLQHEHDQQMRSQIAGKMRTAKVLQEDPAPDEKAGETKVEFFPPSSALHGFV